MPGSLSCSEGGHSRGNCKVLAMKEQRTGPSKGCVAGQGLSYLLPEMGEEFLGVKHLVTRSTCLNLSPFLHLQALASPTWLFPLLKHTAHKVWQDGALEQVSWIDPGMVCSVVPALISKWVPAWEHPF